MLSFISGQIAFFSALLSGKGGKTMLSLRFSWLALMAGALCAMPGYSPADIQAGKQLYGVNCAHRHGPTGNTLSQITPWRFDNIPDRARRGTKPGRSKWATCCRLI
jgi:hypothetical protein